MDVILKNRKLLIFEGILSIILGCFMIAVPGLSTLSMELLLGAVLLVSGIVQCVRSFQMRANPFFTASLVSSILAIAVGFLLLAYPLSGVLTLTFLLSLFFFIGGIAQIVQGTQLRPFQGWGWIVTNGVLSVFMAMLVWLGWPSSATWFIGLLVGIDFLFLGWALIILGWNARQAE